MLPRQQTDPGGRPLRTGSDAGERQHALASSVVGLFQELEAERVPHVVVRGCEVFEQSTRRDVGELWVLVSAEHVERVPGIAHRAGLSHEEQDGATRGRWKGRGANGDGAPLGVRFVAGLHYGGGLRTSEPERLVLGRGRREGGVAVAAPSDELIDLVLHCVLEEGAFQPLHRERARELMRRLRANPPDAGRAAIRVQSELSPALPWCELLDDVVHERWDALLARRARLERRLRGGWRGALLRRRSLAPPGPGERPNGRNGATVDARPASAPPAFAPPTTDAAATTDATVTPGATPMRDIAPTMDAAPTTDAASDPDTSRPRKRGAAELTRKQIRGSGLLLTGYGFSAGMKFIAELIVVRYLATDQYGAWTYALAAVAFLKGISALGLNRAVTRFLPQHLEERQLTEFYGVLFLVLGSVAAAGALVVGSFYAFPETVARLAGAGAGSGVTLAILFVLIFRAPLEVLDNVLLGVSAAFGDSRTIFVRRYLWHPIMRVALAVLLVAFNADVILLAYGYLLAAVGGVGYYAWSVVHQMQKRGLLKRSLLRGLRLPVRRVLSYTAPVMAADWCSVFMLTAGPLLLGYFSDLSAVALYQVVVPVAALNHLVFQSFAMLYEPSAARLVTRGDRDGLNSHYWRSALWVSVLTFPLFALSFTAAVPLTVTLFGERYAAAAPILSVLAFGRFVDSMAGFNAATLRVSDQLRHLILANLAGAVATVAVTVLLIPPMGPIGAAIGAVVGHVTFTLMKQLGLRATAGVTAFDVAQAGPYFTMAVATAGLVIVRVLWGDLSWLVLPAAAVASLAVLMSARVKLSVSDTFPELGRFKLLRTILG